MNRIIALFITLMVIIFFIAVGALGLFIYQEYTKPIQPAATTQTSQLAQSDQQELSKLRLLKSSVVNLIMLYGQVTDVSGSTITLSLDQSNLSFTLGTSASVSSVDTSSVAQKQTAGKVSDIKTGENIQVGAQLTSDNRLVGYSVLIVK